MLLTASRTGATEKFLKANSYHLIARGNGKGAATVTDGSIDFEPAG